MAKAKAKYQLNKGERVTVVAAYANRKAAIVVQTKNDEIIRANLSKRQALSIARFLLLYGL